MSRPKSADASTDQTATSAAPTTWTSRALLGWIQRHLEERGIDSPRVAAELLLASVLGCDRMRLYMEPERPASTEERARLRDLVARAARHEPVQYLLGEAWFFSRAFEVGPAVLIPRPSTEVLVEQAIRWWRAQEPRPMRAIDVGTGSGCIALSLAAETRPRTRVSEKFETRRRSTASAGSLAEAAPPATPEPESPAPTPRPALRVVATDVCASALAVARRNAERHALLDSVDLRQGDLLDAAAGEPPVDLLAANLPYVSDPEWERVAPNVRDHEPTLALRGGRDGLELIRRLLARAPSHLRPGGLLLLEIQHDQGDALRRLLESPVWREVRIARDHEGHDRVAIAVRESGSLG